MLKENSKLEENCPGKKPERDSLAETANRGEGEGRAGGATTAVL